MVGANRTNFLLLEDSSIAYLLQRLMLKLGVCLLLVCWVGFALDNLIKGPLTRKQLLGHTSYILYIGMVRLKKKSHLALRFTALVTVFN